MPFSVGVRVRTTKDAGNKSWVPNTNRKHVRWNETETIIHDQWSQKGLPSNKTGRIFCVSHGNISFTGSLPWYERSELDLEYESNDPAAWLIVNLLKRWDQDEARVLSDVLEECGLHGAAFTLRMSEVSISIRECIEQLSVMFGVRGNARSFGMRNWDEGWVPGVETKGPTGATGPASPLMPIGAIGSAGPTGATGSIGYGSPSGWSLDQD